MSPASRLTASRAAPFAVLAIALVAVSHGAIFARLAADAAPLAIAAWRVTLSSLVVIPLALAFRPPEAQLSRHPALATGAGVLLALHFAFWIASLEYTSIARSVLFVSTAPIWVAVIEFLRGKGAPSRPALIALALATAGVAVVGTGGEESGASTGDLLALAGAVAMAGYLLVARAAQQSLPFLHYLALAYGSAAVLLWIAVLTSGTAAAGFSEATWWALAGMALVSQLVGHSGYNWALRRLKPLFVAIALVGEPILASLLGWWLLEEGIGWRTAAGGVLILAGILLAAQSARGEG